MYILSLLSHSLPFSGDFFQEIRESKSPFFEPLAMSTLYLVFKCLSSFASITMKGEKI